MKLQPGDLVVIKQHKKYQTYSELEGETALVVSGVFIDAKIGYFGDKHRWKVYKVLVRNKVEELWVGFLKKVNNK